MLGLTLAHRLSDRGKRVTILEAADRLGGLASAWTIGDTSWDRHYHVTLLSDSALRGILRELDLDASMKWVVTKTGFYDGRLHPMSNALEYLRLPALNPIDKMRLAFTILLGARVKDWKKLENVLVEDWLVRLSGRRTFETLWRPLLRAKVGERYRETSAAFIWATIQRLYAARRSGMKREMFGYLPGGYARVFETYGAFLENRGVEIRRGAPVASIEASGAGVDVRTEDGVATFDRVVTTAAPSLVNRMCPGLSERERSMNESIAYQGIVCASVLLARPLADYYLTYLTTDDLPFTAVVEMSAFVDPSEFGGRSLVYLPRYAPSSDEYFTLSDDEVRERFVRAIAKMYPGFRPEDVRAFRVSRVRNVFPIPSLAYSEHVPPIETSIPGVFAVSSAHIVNGTLNVNETVQLAERTVEQWTRAARSGATS